VPKKALNDQNMPLYEWSTDAQVNACYNAVNRHVLAGRAGQAAVIHDSPITGSKRVISYGQLQDNVARLAGALSTKGVCMGDRVVIYIPMLPGALEAMLACMRIGAIHSVVFGGFAAAELAMLIDDCTPKAVIATSFGLEPSCVVNYKPLLDGAIEIAKHKLDFCIILQRPQGEPQMV
jgi:propionyl-CoA synthetase